MRLAGAGGGRRWGTRERSATMPIATTNPATGELLRKFDALPEDRIDQAIDRSVAAFRALRETTFAQRAGGGRAAAALLDAEQQAVGPLMTRERGKPLTAAKAGVTKCPPACR